MSTATIAPQLRTSYSRLTSVFVVDRIEPCLDFWVDRLGFEIRLQIDGADAIEFVILGRDAAEVVYRTAESLNIDSPGVIDAEHQPWHVIHVEVENLEEVLPRLEGVDIVVPLRESGFGGHEIYVAEPSGRIVALSGPIDG